jgi:catechol 2,3-dioxygenase-like lactoylglutathione lyase family enzyme
MKRFHVSVSVRDIGASTEFYNTLFGAEPTVLKDDYAKWMLDDPRINFSISKSNSSGGVSHIGLQADTMEELGAIQARLEDAEAKTYDQENAECCYARSTKTWVRDPDEVAWETFVTHGEITHYGGDHAPREASHTRCCA